MLRPHAQSPAARSVLDAAQPFFLDGRPNIKHSVVYGTVLLGPSSECAELQHLARAGECHEGAAALPQAASFFRQRAAARESLRPHDTSASPIGQPLTNSLQLASGSKPAGDSIASAGRGQSEVLIAWLVYLLLFSLCTLPGLVWRRLRPPRAPLSAAEKSEATSAPHEPSAQPSPPPPARDAFIDNAKFWCLVLVVQSHLLDGSAGTSMASVVV